MWQTRITAKRHEAAALLVSLQFRVNAMCDLSSLEGTTCESRTERMWRAGRRIGTAGWEAAGSCLPAAAASEPPGCTAPLPRCHARGWPLQAAIALLRSQRRARSAAGRCQLCIHPTVCSRQFTFIIRTIWTGVHQTECQSISTGKKLKRLKYDQTSCQLLPVTCPAGHQAASVRSGPPIAQRPRAAAEQPV